MLLLLCSLAQAGGLDLIEVAGPWGSPGMGGPAAVWFNPAGLAYEEGTQITIEVAPASGYVTVDRDDPYNGGLDVLAGGGVVPFGGFSTDLGVEGLGVGLAVFAPYGRSGGSTMDEGPASYAVRSGSITNVYVAPGVAFRTGGLTVGGAVHGIGSFYQASTNKEVLTALDDELCDQGQCGLYDDSQLEDADYSARIDLDLRGISASFTVGVALAANEFVSVGGSYVHGAKITNNGLATLNFGCPPDDDIYGRFGSQLTGICDTEIPAITQVRYSLPHRIVGFLRITPTGDADQLSIEGFGGYSMWSNYSSVEITTRVDPNGVALNREEDREATANLLGQDLSMARGLVDTYWVAADIRGRVSDEWTIGTRLTYDRHAIPTQMISPNNFDTDTVVTAVLAEVKLSDSVSLAGSYSHYFQQTRVVDNSAYRVTLDNDNQAPDGFRLPQMNGTYNGSIDRGGVALRVKL